MKKLSFSVGLVGLGFLAAACSGGDGEPAPLPTGAGTVTLAAKLEADLGVPVYVDQQGRRTFAMTRGEGRVVAATDRSTAVTAWLEGYRSELGVARDVTLRPSADAIDALGMHHVLVTTGVPDGVASGGLGVDVTLDEAGHVASISGDLEGMDRELVPALSKQEASKRMLAHLAGSPETAGLDVTEPELRLGTRDDGKSDLVYEAGIGSTMDTIVVSATDGTVLTVGDGSLRAFAEAKSARSYIDGKFSAKGHTLNVGYELTEGNTVRDDKYSLIRAGDSNTTRIVTYGHKGFSEDKMASSMPIVKDSFQEFDADGSKEQVYLGAGKGAAVDAHHWISAADSWYLRTFGEPLGRPDPSGKDRGNVLNIVVHRNDSNPNDGAFRYEAAYVPGANTIYFGDGGVGKPQSEGDRVPLPYPGRTVHPLAIAPDVVGHEAGHIILARRGLQARGDGGVIHEGLSDVLGKLFELSELKRIQRPDLVGYEMFEDGRGLRNLARPSRVDGAFGYKAADAMGTDAYTSCPGNRDKGCVHSRATVIGHAFYLMTFGGRNESTGILIPRGVGLEISTSLWTALLPKPPAGASVGYVPPAIGDIAKRQLAHVLRIYGASVLAGKAELPYQVAAVACAWEAVGVLTPAHVLGITGVPSLCLRASSTQSCVGRPDGTYCDPEHPYSNVTCRNGGIAGALPQCATNKRCVSAGFNYQDKAVVQDGSVLCE